MAKAKKAPQDVEQELNGIPQTEEVAENHYGKKHYQEWRVENIGGKIGKLKIVRERVLITDEQARILNEGVEEGKLNQYASMYFLAE